jgi:hypothetical protein
MNAVVPKCPYKLYMLLCVVWVRNDNDNAEWKKVGSDNSHAGHEVGAKVQLSVLLEHGSLSKRHQHHLGISNIMTDNSCPSFFQKFGEGTICSSFLPGYKATMLCSLFPKLPPASL